MEALQASEEAVRRAAAITRLGGVVIYPTEAHYSLGCDPANVDAARRISSIKGGVEEPLPLACSDMGVARRLVEFNPSAELLASRFWPGPLILVLPARVSYPIWVTRGAGTLGVRVPNHPVARRLAELSGGVIVEASASRYGEPPPTTAGEAAEGLGGEVDLILDGGRAPLGEPPTVVDLSGEEAWILRVGPIRAEQIREALGL